jgi:uncharacterized damage-inducible protein DinB
MTEYLQRMAQYNSWTNRTLLEKTAMLPTEAIIMERGAFFGSLLGTLNHIMVSDILWLRRFAAANDACKAALGGLADFPEAKSLRDILFSDFADFTAARERLDALILDFSGSWTDDLLATPIRYRNMAGEQYKRPLSLLLQHFFNHQTHHRGQVTTLLFQAGIDPGCTDMTSCLLKTDGDCSGCIL